MNGWLDPVNKIGDFGPVGARGLCESIGFRIVNRYVEDARAS